VPTGSGPGVRSSSERHDGEDAPEQDVGWDDWGRVLLVCGRFVRPLEAFAAALDGGDELGEVGLEGAEDLVGVVLGAEANLALLGLALATTRDDPKKRGKALVRGSFGVL
jgi:hypothetical protein